MAHQRKRTQRANSAGAAGRDAEVRIIGGTFRGRRLEYHGDPVVRPMKHRTREAIFNLVSTDPPGRHAIDLFAGTGALGLEALSRGAASATFIEKHVPSARVIQQNIHALEVEGRSTLLVTSAFLWARRDLILPAAAPPVDAPWLVFCSPPYDFFSERRDEMLDLIDRVQQHAPPESVLVVEADDRFDFADLEGETPAITFSDAGEEAGDAGRWNVRVYQPAVVGIWRKL